jgi:hypothetical protein
MDCQVVVALRCAFSVPSGGDVTMMGIDAGGGEKHDESQLTMDRTNI